MSTLRVLSAALLAGLFTAACEEPQMTTPEVRATQGDFVDRVVLTWDPVEGAQEYGVEYEDLQQPGWRGLGGTCQMPTGCETATFIHYIGNYDARNPDRVDGQSPIPGRQYRYRVIAWSPERSDSDYSAPVTGWTNTLGTPSDLRIASIDRYMGSGDRVDGLVRLSWGAVQGADGYRVLYTDSRDGRWDWEWTEEQEVEETSVEVDVDGLAGLPDPYVWAFRVQALIRNEPGAPRTFTYYGEPSSQVDTASGDYPGFGAPVATATQGEHADRVVVTWSEPDGATSYDVERAPEGGSEWTPLADGLSERLLADTAAEPGTRYVYRVRAYARFHMSPWSEPALGWAEAGTGPAGDPLAEVGSAGFFSCQGDVRLEAGAAGPVAACLDAADERAAVFRHEGGSWRDLGRVSDGPSDDVTLAVDGSDLYAAFGDESQASGGTPAGFVRRWDGAAWADLGSGLQRYGSGFAVHVIAGAPHVVYQTGTGSLAAALRYDGTAWSALGGDFLNTSTARSLLEARSGGVPVAALVFGDRAAFVSYDEAGDAWSEAAPQLEKSGDANNLNAVSFAVTADDALAFAFSEWFQDGSEWKSRVFVLRSTGGAWTDLEVAPVTGVDLDDVAVAASGADLWAAWVDRAADRPRIVLKRWSGGTWEAVGYHEVEAPVSSLDLAVAPDGTPYVGFTLGDSAPHLLGVAAPAG